MTIQHLFDVAIAKFSGPNLVLLILFWVSVIGAAIVSYSRSGLPRTWSAFRTHVLPPETLSHPSARADILFYVSRKVVNLIFLIPLALTTVGVGSAVHRLLAAIVPMTSAAPGPISTGTLLIFTVTMFLAYDFSYYVYHNAQHRIPILWEIHKVHHSAEVMVGVTKDRVHPIDDLMNHLWDGFVTGIVYGVWLFLAYDPVELTVFGLNVYALRQILMMDFTRHTHFKISFGRLNGLIICPHYHQLHHSVAPQHWDKNFGLMLAIWDRMFGTLVVPAKDESFVFGLTNEEHREYRSCLRLYYVPLLRIAHITVAWLAPRKAPTHDQI